MRSAFHVRFGSAVVLGVAGLAMVGCSGNKGDSPAGPDKAATVSGDKATKAMMGIRQVQDEINVAKGNVKSLVDAMTALKNSSGGGMQPAFQNFQTALSTMQTHADKVAARSQDMQARAKEYREYWENEVKGMDNAELRAGAQERANKVNERFDAIRGKFEECRKLYQPFVKDCNDVNGYLSKELSASSLGVASGALDKGIADGKQLSKSIDDAIVELVSVSVKMSPETR